MAPVPVTTLLGNDKIAICTYAYRSSGEWRFSVAGLRNTLKKYELFIVVSILLVHIGIKTLLTADTVGPLVYSDELRYKINAESIFSKQPLDTNHYPPLYSFALSPALSSEENWYGWMLFINIIMSSAGGLAVYLISRRFLPPPVSFAVFSLFLLWPFHVTYPRLLMSENLHVCLFLFAVFFALGPEKAGMRRRLFFSVQLAACMAMGYMTKYIFLVAIPIFILLWTARPCFVAGASIRAVLEKGRAIELALMVAVFMMVYSIWLVYAHFSQFSFFEAMGVKFVTFEIGRTATATSLLAWFGIYTAYSVFSFGPFLLPPVLCFVMLAFGRLRIRREDWFLGVAVCLLGCVFVATAVQHSWRAGYNYPVPHRVLGRYLLHLWPLFVLFSLVALDRVRHALDRLSPSLVVLSVTLSLVALWAAAWMLFGHPDWRIKFGFINSPDAALYQFRMFTLSISVGIVLMGMLIGCSRHCRRLARWLMPLVFFFLAGVQLVSGYGAYQFSAIRGLEAVHGRSLAGFLKMDLEKDSAPIILVYGFPETSKYFGYTFASSLKFWMSLATDDTSIEVVPLSEFSDDLRGEAGRTYFLKTTDLGGAVFQYRGAERPFTGLGLLGEWVLKRYPLLRRAQERQTYFLYEAGE